jgi:hypothetical protein
MVDFVKPALSQKTPGPVNLRYESEIIHIASRLTVTKRHFRETRKSYMIDNISGDAGLQLGSNALREMPVLDFGCRFF